MGNFQTYSDTALFQAIAMDNKRAFAELFERFKEKVYGYAFKWTKSHNTAEEITQEVFVNLWINRQALSSVQKPLAFTYRVASNKVYDFLRSSLTHEKIMKEIRERQHSEYDNSTEDLMDAKESEQLILAAVRELSPQKQRIYHLNKIEGKTPVEIADELHLTPSTVRSHLSDVLAYIKTYLKNAALFIGFVAANLLA